MKSLLFTLLLTLGLTAPVLAESLYITTEQIKIPMRSGTSNQHRILRMLPNGTKMDVLEVNKDAGYTQVRTSGGTEGWVQSQYLANIPSARDRLTSAQKKLAEMELQNNERAAKLAEAGNTRESLLIKNQQLQADNKTLNTQLAEIRRTASNALALDSENKQLKNKLLQLEREQQNLVQENDSLKDRSDRDWFMVGAGVIILGIILGLILPRIRVKKRSSWDSL